MLFHRRTIIQLTLSQQMILTSPTLHHNKWNWQKVPSWWLGLMPDLFNSLDPGRCGSRYKSMIFKLITQYSSLGTHSEIALRQIQQSLINEKLALDEMIAWCHQATSHYMSQCWPRSMLPYGITNTQWVTSWRKTIFHWLQLQWSVQPIFLLSNFSLGLGDVFVLNTWWAITEPKMSKIFDTISPFY